MKINLNIYYWVSNIIAIIKKIFADAMFSKFDNKKYLVYLLELFNTHLNHIDFLTV